MAHREIEDIFAELQLQLPVEPKAGGLVVEDPSSGATLARLVAHDRVAAAAMVTKATAAFASLRELPAPRRGELVRLMGERLRRHKEPLAPFSARLV